MKVKAKYKENRKLPSNILPIKCRSTLVQNSQVKFNQTLFLLAFP